MTKETELIKLNQSKEVKKEVKNQNQWINSNLINMLLHNIYCDFVSFVELVKSGEK